MRIARWLRRGSNWRTNVAGDGPHRRQQRFDRAENGGDSSERESSCAEADDLLVRWISVATDEMDRVSHLALIVELEIQPVKSNLRRERGRFTLLLRLDSRLLRPC